MPTLLVLTDSAATLTAVDRAVGRYAADMAVERLSIDHSWDSAAAGDPSTVILMDADLPEPSLENLAKLRSSPRSAERPIMVAIDEALWDASDVESLFPLADALVTKPISPLTLCHQIRRLCCRKAAGVGGQNEVSGRRRQDSLNEAFSFSVFENTGTAILIVDADTTIRRVNREFEKLTGYTKDEVEGCLSWTQFVHPQDRARMTAYHFRRRRQKEIPSVYEFRMVDRKGQVRSILIRVVMIAQTGVSVASLRDITPRKQAEQALRDSENKYRNILENIEEGYFEVDLKGDLIFVNTPLCRMVGRDRKSVLGINNRDYTDSETAKALYRMFHRVYKSGKPSGLKRFRIHVDQRILFVEITASPINDSQGKTIGFRGIVRDVTERTEAEKKQRESERLQGVLEMAGAVCHEVNQPLQSILGYAELIRMETPQTHHHYAKIIKIGEQIDRISDITGKLQRIARYETCEYHKGSKIVDIDKASMSESPLSTSVVTH